MTKTDALDRHALVMTIWLAAGLVAATLFHYGLGRGGAVFLSASFVVVVAAFAGHVIVNVTHRTTFTQREVALGLVLYAASLATFGIVTLFHPHLAARIFLPVGLGFLLVFTAAVFTMITWSGVRGAFDQFDVIRIFRGRRARDRRLVE